MCTGCIYVWVSPSGGSPGEQTVVLLPRSPSPSRRYFPIPLDSLEEEYRVRSADDGKLFREEFNVGPPGFAYGHARAHTRTHIHTHTHTHIHTHTHRHIHIHIHRHACTHA